MQLLIIKLAKQSSCTAHTVALHAVDLQPSCLGWAYLPDQLEHEAEGKGGVLRRGAKLG